MGWFKLMIKLHISSAKINAKLSAAELHKAITVTLCFMMLFNKSILEMTRKNRLDSRRRVLAHCGYSSL